MAHSGWGWADGETDLFYIKLKKLRQQQLAGQRCNGGGSCSQPRQQGEAATTVQMVMDADSGGSISGDMTETEAAHRIRHADAEFHKKCPRCRQHESNAK